MKTISIKHLNINYNINVENYSYKDILSFKSKGYILIENELYEIYDNFLLLNTDNWKSQIKANPNENYDFIRIPNVIDKIVKKLFSTKKIHINKRIYKTYIMFENNSGLYKIGKSINPNLREKTLQSAQPNVTLFAICVNDIEQELHKQYNNKRIRGEWFSLNNNDLKKIFKEYEFKIQ